MHISPRTIHNVPLERILQVLLYSEGSTQVKRFVEHILDDKIWPSLPSEGQHREDIISDNLDPDNTDDTFSWYIEWSDLYDKIDTSNNNPHSFTHWGLPQSPYFLPIIEVLRSGILKRSTHVADILKSPWKYTLWDLTKALNRDASSFLDDLPTREGRKYKVKVGNLLRVIEQDNVFLATLQSDYTRSLRNSVVPSRREWSKNRNPYSQYTDNGLIIESSFGFYRNEDRPFHGEKPQPWCLDRSMQNNAKIWYQYIFWSPPSYTSLIWIQEEIESVIQSGVVDVILIASRNENEWNSGMKDLSRALEFYRSDDLDIYDYTGYLWCYVQGIRYTDNTEGLWETNYYDWNDAQGMVKNMFDSLGSYLSSYTEFITLCSWVPVWRERADVILAYVDSIKSYFTPEFLLGWYKMDDFSDQRDPKFQKISERIRKKITSSYTLLESIIGQLESEWIYFSRFAYLVDMIIREGWAKVSFDSDRKFSYTGGHHPSKAYDDQVPNPSHDDRPISIYSWANTSGKSWWLQRDFIIRRTAQTLWYAPVSWGNFPKQYDMMVYLDRASTNAYARRSAYMEEIHRIKKVLQQCEWKKALIYIDEPFSTTAPADQVAMIEILIEKILTNGWDVVMATHNEEAMKLLQILYWERIGLYHYDYNVERDISWKLYIAHHRTLKTGMSDAHSIEVAEIHGAPSDLIDRARSYLPTSAQLSLYVIPEFPEIKQLSQSEREKLVTKNGLSNLFEGDIPRFHLYSADWDFAQQWIGHNDITHRPKKSNKIRYNTKNKNEYRPRAEYTNVSFANLVDLREVHRLISQMLFAGSAVPVWELLERQAMFGILAQDHNYRAILHLVAGLADIEESFETVSRWKDDINCRLNPISIRSNMGFWFERIPRLTHILPRMSSSNRLIKEDPLRSEVNQAIAYIRMNKRLLKNTSPSELMKLLKELIAYRSFVEKYSDDKRFPVKLAKNTSDGEICSISYMSAFIDESGGWRHIDDLLEDVPWNPKKLTSEKEFLEAASEAFRPFMPAWFSSLESIRDYFSSLRQKVVAISNILPKCWYKIFETEEMQEWLRNYAFRIANDVTGIGISKTKTRVNKDGIWFSFGNNIQNQAEVLTEDLLRIWTWKREFSKLKSTLSSINSPYIRSTLAFLEDQYRKLCQFSIEKETFVGDSENIGNKSGDLHTEKKKHFRRTFEWKKELGRYAFTSELDRLSALCIYASYIAEGRLYPVNFNDTGKVMFPENTNIFESIKHSGNNDEPIQSNDFMLDANFPYRILTGPNGSGKTYFAKSGIVSVLQALNTGYSQSQYSTVPIFDHIIYFDRVNEQDGIHSSFANELEYWKEVWKTLESWGRTLLFCDEMFSTVPPKYQAAFSHSVMDKTIRTWTSFITASHHHDWVSTLMEELPSLPVSHISFEIINGTLVFQRKIKAWHAPSHAKEVARKLWFF